MKTSIIQSQTIKNLTTMKKSILKLIVLILLCTSNIICEDAVAINNTNKATLSIACTPELSVLADKWVSEYGILFPDLNIQLTIVSETDIPDVLQGSDISFVSSQSFKFMDTQSTWQTVLGRDIIVPVFNSQNPLLDQINEKGISAEDLVQIILNPNTQDWGMLFGNDQNVPAHYYMVDDKSLKAVVANFLDIDQSAFPGILFEKPQELISTIQNDPLAIGFCRISDIIDLTDQTIVENIQILPIDKNNNDKIDYHENIYNDLHAFMRGVWIGKYPKSLCSNIYAVSRAKPVNETEIAFLKWVLTGGQQFLIPNGYSDLAFSERQNKLDKLTNDKIYVENDNTQYATAKVILIIIIGLVILGFLVGGVMRYKGKKEGPVMDSIIPPSSTFNENSLKIPKGLYFDNSHTWAFMEKDGIVKVGIDDFLQHTTGRVTRTILKNPGDMVKKGEQVLTLVQNGKHLNIYAPISGTVEEINEQLITDPSVINSSPYGEGWVYMIEPSNWLREVEFLKMAGSYKHWLINEFIRLKDFIATSTKPGTPEFAQVVLQDGGELIDNVLQELRPEVWEDFQKHFIDTSQLR